MRAGSLDRTIKIQSLTTDTAPSGEPIEAWTDFATVRAQLLQASTEEYIRAYGVGENLVVIFRTRWLDGVTLEHRIQYEGKNLNIREVKEIGRRHGLEIRCEQVR